MSINRIKSTFKKILLVFIIYLPVWGMGKFYSYLDERPKPWDPEVNAILPDWTSISFRARSCAANETEDRLIWITPDGRRRDFMVDRIHAGFSYVTIKIRDDGKGIWVESDEKVGASLDLISGEFRGEFEQQFFWATYGAGKTIAEGRTWSIPQALLPW